jgi:hypothetical protein
MKTFKITTFGISNFTLTARTMLRNMITVYKSENIKCSLYFVTNHGKYQDSIVVIATRIRGWKVGGRIPGRGKRFFPSPTCLDRLSGPPRLLFNGYGGSFLEMKLSGLYVNHTPATRPRLRMSGVLP